MATSWAVDGRVQGIYVVKETTLGTLVYPTSADFIPLATGADPEFSQEAEVLQDVERRRSYGRALLEVLGWQAGEFSFRVPIKTKGAATNEPVGGIFLEALLGKKTTGSNVTYSPHTVGKTLPSLSITVQIGPLVYWLSGCVVNEGTFAWAFSGDDGILHGVFAGKFLKQIWQAPDTFGAAADGSTTPFTSFTASKPDHYSVGAKIYFINSAGTVDDNAGAGYQVTNISGSTITISPGSSGTYAIGNPIKPFTPTPTISGNIVYWSKSMIQENKAGAGYVDRPTISGNLRVTNNIDAFFEVARTQYPTKIARSTREVTLSDVQIYMADDSYAYLKDAEKLYEYGFKLVAGDTAGDQLIFELSKCRASSNPTFNKDTGVLIITRNFVALETSADDELSIYTA